VLVVDSAGAEPVELGPASKDVVARGLWDVLKGRIARAA